VGALSSSLKRDGYEDFIEAPDEREYFFEGSRYWKPLASRNGERHYFEPGWVR
jgi:hypothetical protein